MRARKRFAQHFLEPAWVNKLVMAVAATSDEAILEIGPGRGAITRPLAAQAGKLLAIEIDRDLAADLEAGNPDNVTVVTGDVLSVDLQPIVTSWLGAAPGPDNQFRIVGNLPYNISSPMLFHLAHYEANLRDMTVMLQREVVQRMAAAPATPDYGRLSVMLQTRFKIERLFIVPPGAFRPTPLVDSAIARLTPLQRERPKIDDEALFARVVAAAFGQRRKTLKNALKLLATAEELEREGIAPGARGETLAVTDFVRLANALARAP
jgi:16S rRNA (adenine1518-N6/adenine1519-N6)-dimethyltransferase